MSTRTLALAGFLLSLAALCALTFGCHQTKDPWDNTTKPRVVASFPPIYCFAENVGGDNIALRCLCTSRGPHDYEYNPRDTMQLKTADLLLSNGEGMDDHFVGKLHANADNPKLRSRKLAESNKITLERMREHKNTPGVAHHHGDMDPHVWLGLEEAVVMVNGVRDELQELDPGHAREYETNAAAYVKRLKDLREYGREKLAGKNLKMVTFHESLTYFARNFDIEIVGTIQGVPGTDPNSQHLTALVNLCKEKKVQLITIEPQYPSDAAKTLQASLKNSGVNAQLVRVDTLETVDNLDQVGPTWYEDEMRKNIDRIAEKLAGAER